MMITSTLTLNISSGQRLSLSPRPPLVDPLAKVSQDMYMDASSIQENCETDQSSSPRQTTSIQDHQFNSTSSGSQGTEGKHAVISEHVKEGLPEAGAAECNYDIVEEVKPESSSPRQTTSVLEQEFGSGSLASQAIEEHLTIQKISKDFRESGVTRSHSNEPSGPLSATTSLNSDQLDLLPENVGEKHSSAEQAMPELNLGRVSHNENSDAFVEKQEIIPEVNNLPVETGKEEISPLGCEPSGLAFEDASQIATWEQVRSQPEDGRKPSLMQWGLPPEDEAEKTSVKQLKLLADNGMQKCDLGELKTTPENAAQKSRGRPRKTSAKSSEGKRALRSMGSTRVLRPRSQEKLKNPEPSNTLQELRAGARGERRRKKRKKKQMKNVAVDEFSRTRKHLRYLLHRMAYEQNLIDAYSGEGWKGQSLEKLRPERELQRAKSEIFRCKLKIRDLFQRIDLSTAEGRLPQSLFDSEGEIDSEDIFCAKCGSKDVTLNNDIILCDGACERGFHQFCVQPPLLKEDIPPDDEGWLCPGCDCKDDCIDLLNESQGTNLSILDTWEKVYPEAAAAAASGNALDNNFELPSDDSEDNDYKPDDSEGGEKDDGDESSAEESDIYSDSEDSGVSPGNKQNLHLPYDDSEDDDYDPDAIDDDEEVKQESASSDFTSDSEEFSVAIDANGSPHKNLSVPDEPISESSKWTEHGKSSDRDRFEVGRGKRPSLNDELSSLLESAPSQGESAHISAKREVERLDYKKLYDETYGNVSTDSSDEDFIDVGAAPKRRRKSNTNNEKTPERRASKKQDVEGRFSSPTISNKVSSEPSSSCGSTKKSPYKRLGEAVTQGLLKFFKENQYPERATKEKLAEELGLTVHQVSKWFENARWSFRHSSHLESKLAEIPCNDSPSQINQSELKPKTLTEDVKNGSKNEEETQKGGTFEGRKSPTPRGSNKRRNHQSSKNIPSNEETPVDVSKSPEKRKRGRPRRSEI